MPKILLVPDKKAAFGSLFFGCSLFCRPAAAQPENERPPAAAGQFYPANPGELRNMVDHLLAGAGRHGLDGELSAILVPHAGYQYSGPIAAEAFKTLKDEWPSVILIGPSHHVAVKGAALVARGSFRTPLGSVPVDEELAGKLLAASPVFAEEAAPHAAEHSLEVQLPFLQRRLKRFRILPVVMNTEDLEIARKAGLAIAEAVRGRKTLLVISSDLSHYPRSNVARPVDQTFLKALERLDPEYLKLTGQTLMSRGEPELFTVACGETAIWTGLYAAKALGANQAQILRYANSGELVPDTADRSVGYAAVAFVHAGRPKNPDLLDKKAQQRLLDAARTSIADGLAQKRFSFEPLNKNYDLNLPAAVFVTLRRHGELRGCVGTVEPQFSLWEAVRHFARSAAFEDTRFQPLEQAELKDIRVEISILSPPQRIKDAGEIVPGRDGVIVRNGRHSGLFLPEVWESLPDKTSFLDTLCSQKAGLPPGCWKDPSVELRVFRSEAFSE
jgi:AmmeMemoRadiSam system protein B/AmmeMemoRadiSam system protein A